MTDMQDRIKELAIEAGLIDCVNDHGQLIIDRGAECGSIYGERSAHAIRARFGIAKEWR